MRFLGVKVDVSRAHELKRQLTLQEEMLLHKIKKETGIDTQIWAARSIAKVFEKLHLPFDRTEKTNSPSFTKNFLSSHEHPLVKMIAEARESVTWALVMTTSELKKSGIRDEIASPLDFKPAVRR